MQIVRMALALVLNDLQTVFWELFYKYLALNNLVYAVFGPAFDRISHGEKPYFML